MKKKRNVQFGLSIFLIIVQFIAILSSIANGTIANTFNDIGYAIGFYIYGIIGIPTLILELKKRKQSSSQ